MQKTIHILLNPLPSKQQNKTKPTKTLSLFLFWIFQVLFINRKSLADVVPFQSWTSNVFICCAKSACKTKTKTNIKKGFKVWFCLSTWKGSPPNQSKHSTNHRWLLLQAHQHFLLCTAKRHFRLRTPMFGLGDFTRMTY